MLPHTAHFTTMLLSPGVFRPKVRLHFSHLSPSGVGLPQQGHYERIGAHRDGLLYKGIYHQRTSAEHINSQAQALGIERPKVRNGHSVKNINTLMYRVINARILAKAQSINRGLLHMNWLRPPFGMETIALKRLECAAQWLNGLGSPFGMETEHACSTGCGVFQAKWPGEPVRDGNSDRKT